jgi:hypothetical protein
MQIPTPTTGDIVAHPERSNKAPLSGFEIIDLGDGSFTIKESREAGHEAARLDASVAKMVSVAAAIAIFVTSAGAAQAQYRVPLPGGYRVAPQMVMPSIRGASQLGWYAGRQLSIRQYGPTADPGRWPGLAPALGFGRR